MPYNSRYFQARLDYVSSALCSIANCSNLFGPFKSSFEQMFFRCVSTVAGLRKSSAAISFVALPFATNPNPRRSGRDNPAQPPTAWVKGFAFLPLPNQKPEKVGLEFLSPLAPARRHCNK